MQRSVLEILIRWCGAAGMAASQLRLEYTDGALTVRTRGAESAAITEAPVPHSGTDILLRPGSFERGAMSAPQPASTSASADEMLRRVQALIDQSESRQRRELALRLQDVMS